MVFDIRCLSRIYSMLNVYIYVLIVIYNIYNNLKYLQEYSFILLSGKSQIETPYVSLLLNEIALKT